MTSGRDEKAMDHRRTFLRAAAGVGLTTVLAAFTLSLLLIRLGDHSGAWWTTRIGVAGFVATLAALTATHFDDPSPRPVNDTPQP